MPEWLASLIAAIQQRGKPAQPSPQPGDPMLADVTNPRLSLNRRMSGSGEALPGLLDPRTPGVAPAGAPGFQRPFSPEQVAQQRARLVEVLAQRRY